MKIQKHSVFSSLSSLLLDEQLLWQLNRIRSMGTLDKVVSAVAGVHGPAPEGDTRISISPCVSLLSQG